MAERERRYPGRSRHRVAVRFGVERVTHLGYTTDLGENGLFLRSNKLHPPGTILQLELDHPDGVRRVRGVVRWVKQVSPAFRHSHRGGMGIEFLAEVSGGR
jgi:hypothetical protein